VPNGHEENDDEKLGQAVNGHAPDHDKLAWLMVRVMVLEKDAASLRTILLYVGIALIGGAFADHAFIFRNSSWLERLDADTREIRQKFHTFSETLPAEVSTNVSQDVRIRTIEERQRYNEERIMQNTARIEAETQRRFTK